MPDVSDEFHLYLFSIAMKKITISIECFLVVLISVATREKNPIVSIKHIMFHWIRFCRCQKEKELQETQYCHNMH